MEDYINYNSGVRVKIIETGEVCEAFESALGYISVWHDGEDKITVYKLIEVEFI